jgi:hypothetical protein
MEIGDRVKVARLDQYTLDVIMATNAKSPIGMTGTIIEKYYNHNMRRDEVVVEADGTWDKWLWTPWNLDIICGH